MTEYERQDPRERSVSGDYESDLDGSHADGTPAPSQPGKPGRKKNPNSQAARRDQNRIAQREFRLRKQQRIRDLEAKVEILSGGKEEAMSEMRNMLKDLMAENQNLRQILRSLASFIGDGMGGVLPKLGWELNDFNTFLNKGETDTAWEGYQQRKKMSEQGRVASTSMSSLPTQQKRPSEDVGLNTRAKKARNDLGEDRMAPNGFNSMMNSMGPPGGLFPQENDRNNGMFPDLLRGGPTQPIFAQPPTASNSALPYANLSNSMEGYPNPYLSLPINQQQQMSAPGYDPPNGAPAAPRMPAQDEEELDDDPNKTEAYKLIHYHLENYKRNPGYCLPSSLRPTNVQRSIPHQSVIDSVIHPELRDRMILLRDRYEMVDCLVDFRKNTTIHGDDVLAHGNWEVGELFFRKYPFLAETGTLSVSNRWRKERGEPELRLSDYSEAPPA